MGSWVQSTVGCFHELCFLQVLVGQVIVGLRKQFINNFVFTTWACAADFNNNNNNNNIIIIMKIIISIIIIGVSQYKKVI